MFYKLNRLSNLVIKDRILQHILRRGATWGWCPICEKPTVFYKTGTYTRAHWLCAFCKSIPRFRALMQVLEVHFPDWRQRRIHESSPGGPASRKLAAECPDYLPTQYWPNVQPGDSHGGCRCENLEQQTFPDASFDLVITQDVFEHVLEPARGFAEIERTLRPGGAHVFTVPWFYWKATLVRARREKDQIQLLEPPDYHGNPVDPNGSLVVTEWGWDFCDFIYRHSGLTTTVLRQCCPRLGIAAQFIEVFVSQKPGDQASQPLTGAATTAGAAAGTFRSDADGDESA